MMDTFGSFLTRPYMPALTSSATPTPSVARSGFATLALVAWALLLGHGVATLSTSGWIAGAGAYANYWTIGGGVVVSLSGLVLLECFGPRRSGVWSMALTAAWLMTLAAGWLVMLGMAWAA